MLTTSTPPESLLDDRGRVFGPDKRGDPEQAQEYLTTARAMYGEMGMTHWLEKLEKDGPFVT